MAEITGANKSYTYYKTFEGKLAKRLKEPGSGPGYVTRELEDGKKIHEKHVDGISGKLISISIREEPEGSKYEPKWEIVLDDGNELANLQLIYSSRQAQSFLKRLPNIDLSGSFEIRVGKEEKGDYINTFLWVTQGLQPDGKPKKVPQYYTTEDPKGCPSLEKKEEPIARGKTKITYSSVAMLTFLEHMVEEKIQPKLKALYGEKKDVTYTEKGIETEDDLPF